MWVSLELLHPRMPSLSVYLNEMLVVLFIINPTYIVIASEAKQSLLAGGHMLKRLPLRSPFKDASLIRATSREGERTREP